VNQGGSSYLLTGQPTELERLQLQSRVWEPAGRELLTRLPGGSGRRALDMGCGAMGWLRILSEWVGPGGSVVGADIDDKMLAGAKAFVDAERLQNVTLSRDDLFASQLSPGSFDLVHSRFQIAPLGRAGEQLAVYRRLVKPGGWMIIEDPDMASWRVNPDAPGVERLLALIEEGFRVAGGNFNAGRELPGLLRGLGVEPSLDARIVALPSGHPYLRLPLQFATSLRLRLEALIGKAGLEDLLRQAEEELNRPGTWGTTFTLIQAYVSLPA
jgi:SAM-dependent methyltransferase